METEKKYYGTGSVIIKLTTISEDCGVNRYEFKFPYSDDGPRNFPEARNEASAWFDNQLAESSRMVSICSNLMHRIKMSDVSKRNEVNVLKSIMLQSF